MFCWSQAEKELCNAKKILDDNRAIITCTKYANSLEVTINQEMGDLLLCSKSYRNVERPPIDELSRVKHLYILALNKLISSGWRHSYSSPEKVGALQATVKESPFDDCAKESRKKLRHDITHLILTSFETNQIHHLCDQMICWHCLHLETVKSNSLRRFICMNWDLVQRKLSLKLLISLGKMIFYYF